MPIHGCDPLRVWGRLEPRPRQVELDRALQARIADPLWMLTRQWQFGEFHGEDTGSLVMATVARRVSPVLTAQAGQSAGPYSAALPMETTVERLPIDFPPVARAGLGRQFLTMLAARLAAVGVTNLAPYRATLCDAYPLVVPPLDPADPADALAVARRRAAAAAHRVLLALAARSFDGVALARAAPASGTALPAELAGLSHPDVLAAALEEYAAWFRGLYQEPAPGTGTAWNGARLEYDFGCTVARDGPAAVKLLGTSSPNGRLDWYSFDLGGQVAAAAHPAPAWEVTSSIPAPAEFAGMPDPRWWQLEDAAVDLGRIRADAADLASILVAEFALLYGNNWLVIPYEQQLGSLAEVAGIVVTDVFGQRTLISSATGSAGTSWARWDLFSLAPRRQSGTVPLGQHLWLPPAVPAVLEGEVAEEVVFVRDEASNLVWAVEARVPDGLGGGRDGADVARRVTSALATLEAALAGPTPQPATSDAPLAYRLGTTVPENWIPFLPVQLPQDTSVIRLQRGSMPRFFPPGVPRVRPVTSILRDGLAPDDSQPHPYYVNEEEVSRAGEVVRAALRRTRWLNGTVLVWHARRRASGRGGGSSGLTFDVLERTGQ